MAPRNPSELQRLEEEALSDERVHLLQEFYGTRYIPLTKEAKENILRRIRAIERQLGIEGIPYNSNQFNGR